jgi:hypothetical protein
MRLPLLSLVAVAFTVVGCSSPDTGTIPTHRNTPTPEPSGTTTPPGTNDTTPPVDPGTPPPTGTPTGTGTWADGMKITSNILISAGATVTIAPGATITVSPGVSITIQGTLKATTNTAHAKLTSPDAAWGGLVVASGGTLTADSLDLSNAAVAIWTRAGDADATYANGAITAAQPFNMEKGSKLSVSHASAKGSGESAIAGSFTAKYLAYDKAGSGLYVDDPAGVVSVEDSTLTGNGGGDYLIVNAAASFAVSYTTITGSHCPFHFSGGGPTKYTIDHVSDDVNGSGFMLYGSGAGPNTISNSNFRDSVSNLDISGGTPGKVTLTNNFFGGMATAGNITKSSGPFTVVSTAPAAINNARPR